MNKYRNKKTVVDNITFDSKAEARRYIHLRNMEDSGIISDLQLQPKYLLQDGYGKNGKRVRAMYYMADFYYKDNGGFPVIEDVKGMETSVFKLKKKLFEYKYPYTITIVK
jgi:hypothetical protein